MTIEEQWLALEQEQSPGDVWRMQLARPLKGHPLFVAFDGKRRALLLRVTAVAIPQKNHWPVCKGLEILAILLGGHAYFGVSLREARFGDVFTALAEDLARRIAQVAGNTPAKDVGVMIGQLTRWQRFLAASNVGLGPEAQRGLFGELHFLNFQLLPKCGSLAVTAWKGPDGAHQDFQFPGVWVEVKTTLAKQPQSVRITSERQLDNTHGPSLFLHVLMLEIQEGGGLSLPVMVGKVRDALNSSLTALEIFEDSLLAAGYLDIHASRYLGIGYAIRKEEHFHVLEGFPRLIESDLPAGLGDTSYHLSLAACSAFAATPDAFANELSSMLKPPV